MPWVVVYLCTARGASCPASFDLDHPCVLVRVQCTVHMPAEEPKSAVCNAMHVRKLEEAPYHCSHPLEKVVQQRDRWQQILGHGYTSRTYVHVHII